MTSARLFRLAPLLTLPCLGQVATPELRSTAADRRALSITIYQNDLAAVRDTRRVMLPAGVSRLAFAEVAASIRPKSAYLLDPGTGLRVLERNFEFNLLNPLSLEQAGLAQDAAVRDASGVWTWGTQASLPMPKGLMNPAAPLGDRFRRKPSAFTVQPTQAFLVRTAQGYESTSAPASAYRRVSDTLRATPTLLQTLQADEAGARDLTLAYTTQGLNWWTHYIVTVSADGRRADLDARASIENKSGIAYPDTRFQLVAGQPNQVDDPMPADPSETTVTVVGSMVMASVAGPAIFREERVSEYPLFTLDRPITVGNGQMKQVRLFAASDLPLRLEAIVSPSDEAFGDAFNSAAYLKSCHLRSAPMEAPHLPIPVAPPPDPDYRPLTGGQRWVVDHRPAIHLQGSIENEMKAGLGRAIPFGNLEVRYETPDGFTIPLGSADEDGSAAGEAIRFPIANARFMDADREILGLKQVPEGNGTCWELEVALTARSAMPMPVKTTFREPFPREWTLVEASLPGHRSGENACDFEGICRPGKPLHLHYTLRSQTQGIWPGLENAAF